MKNILYSFLLVFALFLTGCADAGKNQTVNANDIVTLEGNTSTPSVGGEITAYSWHQVKGKKVTLSNKRAVNPTFTAPEVNKKTRLVFKLTTKETGGIRSPFSSRDYVKIIVEPKDTVENVAPTAVIDVNTTAITTGDTVEFSAQNSTDSDGQIVSYSWEDDVENVVSEESSFTHTFTQAGSFGVKVIVTDDDGAHDTTRVTITVTDPVDTVKPVITLLGDPSVSLTVGQTYIDAGVTAQDETDGNITANILTNNPVDTSTPGTYTVAYNVSDAAGNAAEEITRTVTVNASQNVAPTAVITADKPMTEDPSGSKRMNIEVGTTVHFSAESSTDSDGQIASYSWEDDAENVVSEESTFTYTFTHAGSFGIKAIVIDDDGAHDVTSVVVTVTDPVDTIKPVITLLGEVSVSLTVGQAYSDAGATAQDETDGNITANILTNNPVDTSTPGTYTVAYNVSDAAGNAAEEVTRTVIVNASQNIAPTAVITADQPMIEDTIGPNLMEIIAGTTVHFSAENSTDTDGQIVSYFWTNPEMVQLCLIDDLWSYTCPGDSNYTHTFENAGTFDITLTVKDDDNASGEKTVRVHVSENNDTNASGEIIFGHITDTNGTAITGATVTIGTKSTVSDANGSYSINGIEAAERVNVNVTHPDYLANSRIVPVGDDNVTLDIKLGAAKATSTFASTDGGSVSHDGASVDLPVNGYVDSNGTPYTGQVTVRMSYYPITTRNGRATFPGTFEGKDANGTFPIQSYGFMNVELTDPQGKALNLDGNSTATLTYPRDNSIYPQPTTIPLWYYDEMQGYWIQEGEATQVGYSSYVGTVTHFTSWNLDAKGSRAKFTGCVEDQNGNRVPNALVQFSSTNWDSYTVSTDENGSISVFNILAQTNLNFGAYAIINNSIYYGDKNIYLSEGEDKVDTACVVLSQQGNLPNIITVNGVILDDHSHANEDIYLAPTRTSNILGQTKIDANSRFTITFQPSNSLSYTVGQDFDGYLYGNIFQIHPNKNIYSITIDRRVY